MPEIVDIRAVIQTHKILLDTSFAMQRGFQEFINTYGMGLRHNPILIPALVLWELTNLCSDSDLTEIAQHSLKQISVLVHSGLAELRYENGDIFQDLVILRVTLQHRLSHDIAVLTNDTKLMCDLRAMWNCKSVTTDYRLAVLKLHGRTQRPCSFNEQWQAG